LPALAFHESVVGVIASNSKPVWCSIGHLVAAIAVYRYLITGGWLTKKYQLNDPNIINLGLAIFEPIAVGCVVAYWIWRTQFLGRLLSRLFLVQILIGAGFLAFMLLFFFTWRPKLM
jgi:hypothetical protein